MANSKQASKRIRQSEKRRQNNKWQVTRMRTAIKNVRQLVVEKSYQLAMDAFKVACSLMDRLQVKGKIHKNKVARLKSRINASIKKLLSA